MASDPFADLRKADTGLSHSFAEHLEHVEHDGVFFGNPQKSAIPHPEHPEHRESDDRAERGSAEAHLDENIARSCWELALVLIPDVWRAGAARLSQTVCPEWIEPARWQVFVDDALRFLVEWGDDALDAGWSIGSLFGGDPDEALVCLIGDLNGDRVASLWKDVPGQDMASIRTADGYRLHRRQMPDGSPLIWRVDPRIGANGQ